MATIYKHDGPYTREEQLANDYPQNKLAKALSNEALAEIRAKAQARPQHNTHSADNARRIAEAEARRAAAKQ